MDAAIAVPLFAILAGCFIVALVILFPVIILWLILSARAKRSRTSMNQNEMRMVQEIHAGLDRMEKRIEALEAILMEQMKAR
ncbi:hypothetical protein AMJ85_09535 [candidate division BRC1 bacterium SM23_51]|nr:MAG: hypothetical protein AMJ85_09535 [candidate division BRC1 bacterium SM23_51]